MSWAQKTVIASDTEWRMTLHEPEDFNPAYASKTLVTFGEIGSDLDSPGFGAAYAQRSGIRFLYVAQRKGTQYQHLSRSTFAAICDKHLRDEQLYMYGTSIGGYCAAYFGRPLGTNILALAPRIPAHPATGRLMTVQFKNDGYRHDPLYSGVTSSTASLNQHVLYDRHNSVDSFYVETEVMTAFPNAHYHHVEDAGHYVPRALMLSGELKKIVDNFMSDRAISFNIDSTAVLDWHEQRFREHASNRKPGYAAEHLAVLIRKRERSTLNDMTRFYIGTLAH